MGCSQSETEIAIEVLRQVCNTFQNCEQFQRSFSDIQKKIKVIISFALYSLKNSVADPDLVETASLDLTFFYQIRILLFSVLTPQFGFVFNVTPSLFA